MAPSLTFGAHLEVNYEYRKDLGLDDRPDNDASAIAPELSLAFSWDPDPRFQAFLNVVISKEAVWKIEADASRPSEDVALELQEAFVLLRALPGGLSLSRWDGSDSRTSASGSTTRSSTRPGCCSSGGP
jgi:hypothetical protein